MRRDKFNTRNYYGLFEGAPNDDSKSEACLQPIETLPCTTAGGQARLPDIHLPPISLTVLRLAR